MKKTLSSLAVGALRGWDSTNTAGVAGGNLIGGAASSGGMHTYKAPENTCQICGMPELDHYWKCPKCGMVGNGVDNHECHD